MSGLYSARQSQRTSGAFSITMKDGAALIKKLEKIEDGGRSAIQTTVNELTTRAPAKVKKAVKQYYGVDNAAFKAAGPKKIRGATKINVTGITVDGASLEYKGRTLTPTHFSMKPKSRPKAKQKKIKIPGQATTSSSPVVYAAPSKPYTVSAQIIAGQRAAMPNGTFIGKGLPYQRTGEGRTPVEVIHTLSVPQMISGRAKEAVEQEISDLLETRFNHNMERAMSKL